MVPHLASFQAFVLAIILLSLVEEKEASRANIPEEELLPEATLGNCSSFTAFGALDIHFQQCYDYRNAVCKEGRCRCLKSQVLSEDKEFCLNPGHCSRQTATACSNGGWSGWLWWLGFWGSPGKCPEWTKGATCDAYEQCSCPKGSCAMATTGYWSFYQTSPRCSPKTSKTKTKLMQTCNKNTGGTCMLSAGAWAAADVALAGAAYKAGTWLKASKNELTAAAKAGGKWLKASRGGLTGGTEAGGKALAGWFKGLVHLGEGAAEGSEVAEGTEVAEGSVTAKSNKVTKKMMKSKKVTKKIMKSKKVTKKIMKSKKVTKKIMKSKKVTKKIMKTKKVPKKMMDKSKIAKKMMDKSKIAKKIMTEMENVVKDKGVENTGKAMLAGGIVLGAGKKHEKARVNDAVNSSEGLASLHGYRPKGAPDPDLFGQGSNCYGYRDAICTAVVAPLPGDMGKAAEMVDQTTNFLWHGIKSTKCMCRPTDCTVYSQKHSGLVCIYGPLLTMASEVIQDVEDPSFEHVTSFAYNGLSAALRGYGLDDPTSFMETNRHMLRQFADHQECLQQISVGGNPDDECKAFVCSFANGASGFFPHAWNLCGTFQAWPVLGMCAGVAMVLLAIMAVVMICRRKRSMAKDGYAVMLPRVLERRIENL